VKTRSALLTIVFAFVLTTPSGVQAAKRAGASDDPPVGPYTEIRLPLEDLPEPNQDLVYNPVIDQYPSGMTLQVLHVLKDPRDVPMARFAYYSTASDSIVPPNNYYPNTVNVYVRVQAPEDRSVHDPVFASYYQDLPLGSTPALHVSAGNPSGSPDSGYPGLVSCAMPEYADSTKPYQLPDDIKGGKRWKKMDSTIQRLMPHPDPGISANTPCWSRER